MPEDPDSDSGDEMDIKSEPSSPTPESGSPVGMARLPPAPALPVQATTNSNDAPQNGQPGLSEQSARLGQISTLKQQSTQPSQLSLNSSPLGNHSVRRSVETGESSALPGTQPTPGVQTATPRRRQEIKPRSSRITPKCMLPLMRSALPFKYFMESLSYKKEIFERIAVDYETQFKKAVHPSTVHRHFKIAILQFRKTSPTPEGRMAMPRINDLELDLILQEMSHWIAGWEEKPNMSWDDAKARESTAISAWVEEFESAMAGYEECAWGSSASYFTPPLFRSDPGLISLEAQAWRKDFMKHWASLLPRGTSLSRQHRPSRPRHSSLLEDTTAARDRYRGITPPQLPSADDPDYRAKWTEEILKHGRKRIERDRQTREEKEKAAAITPSSSISTAQRPLPSPIPPRANPQPQAEQMAVATPPVRRSDPRGRFVWKDITTPQMPDPRMIREQDLPAQQATSTSHPPIQPPSYQVPSPNCFPKTTPRVPHPTGPVALSGREPFNSATQNPVTQHSPVTQHPPESATMLVEKMTDSLNSIGAAVIAAVKDQAQNSTTESHPKQTDLLQLQTSVDRLTGQVQSLEAQMKLLTEALLKK